jgi:hypothetical protein
MRDDEAEREARADAFDATWHEMQGRRDAPPPRRTSSPPCEVCKAEAGEPCDPFAHDDGSDDEGCEGCGAEAGEPCDPFGTCGEGDNDKEAAVTSGEMVLMQARGYFASWNETRGEARVRFEAELRRMAATDSAAASCLARILALRGGMLLDAARVRSLYQAAALSEGPVPVERGVLAELCEAWLAAHLMCGGEE